MRMASHQILRKTKKYSKKLTLMPDLQYLLGDIRVDVDVNINDLIEAIFQKPGKPRYK